MSPSSPTPTEIAEAVEILEAAVTIVSDGRVRMYVTPPLAASILTVLAAYTARGEALEALSPPPSGEELVEAVARVIEQHRNFWPSHQLAREIITLIRSSLGGGDGK